LKLREHIFFDIFNIIIPSFAALGTALVVLDILLFFWEKEIINKNFFTMIGFIVITIFYTWRSFSFFDRKLKQWKRERYTRQEREEEHADKKI